MELTGGTLRDAEFRERLRGYHPVDVDRFLENVAAGVDDLVHRLAVAEAAVAGSLPAAGPADDEAGDREGRRAAAEALVEAHRAAAKIVASAHEEAKRIIAEAVAQTAASLEQARVAESSAAALLHALADIGEPAGPRPAVVMEAPPTPAEPVPSVGAVVAAASSSVQMAGRM